MVDPVSVADQDNETTFLQAKDIIEEESKDWPQIMAVLIACLSTLSSGLFIAWPSPFIVKITQDKDNYAISEYQASYFTIWINVGITVFSPFFTIFSIPDIIGRKRTLLLSAFPHVSAWLMKAFSGNVYVLNLARFIAGLGDAIIFASLPAYIGETTTPKVRGVWGNSLICSLFLGQFLMNVIGAYCSVQHTSFICLTVPVIFLVSFLKMPESPYFYLMKGREGEAKSALQRLRGTNAVDGELMKLKVALARQMSENGTWKDLIMIRSNRRALAAAVFLRVSQVTAGFYVFASYTQFIFEKSGGNVSSEVSSIIYIGLSFVLFSVGAYFSDKFGRQKSYMISLSLSSAVLFLEAVYFYIDAKHSELNMESIKWFPLAGMLVYIIFSSFGVGIIPTLMLGELFSASVKSKGVGVVTTLFGLFLFVGNYIFYLINSYTGLYGPFLLFGCCTVISAIVTNFIVPETKGKSLEEIQQILKGKKAAII
ncbi:facilitated trehalose transporter Tret1 isoform X1 [Leptinotarsa decemlineata]|uniref:facilitated trehalose transporter Tret1 isoform X1 n=2 Tax=Leptinotarsa decemlineata TaxID=7539 RepID=UPI003D3094A6